MFALNRVTRFTALASMIGLTSGCATTLQTPNLSLISSQVSDAEQASPAGAISVTELLSRARGQTASNGMQTTLKLSFPSESLELTPRQQDQLNQYANQRSSQTLQVDCAPSAIPNQVKAASVAISRCMRVSTFLEKRAHATAMALNPALDADLIHITESE